MAAAGTECNSPAFPFPSPLLSLFSLFSFFLSKKRSYTTTVAQKTREGNPRGNPGGTPRRSAQWGGFGQEAVGQILYGLPHVGGGGSLQEQAQPVGGDQISAGGDYGV